MSLKVVWMQKCRVIVDRHRAESSRRKQQWHWKQVEPGWCRSAIRPSVERRMTIVTVLALSLHQVAELRPRCCDQYLKAQVHATRDPCLRAVDTAREHGPWTRVVCTKLKVARAVLYPPLNSVSALFRRGSVCSWNTEVSLEMLMIILRKIVGTVLCCIVYNSCAQWYAHTYEHWAVVTGLTVGLYLGFL